MTEFDYASQQLRVIRSLMERATIYRAISAPTALLAGILSLGGFGMAYYSKHHLNHPLTTTEFVLVWLVVLVMTMLINVLFLSRNSARRGEPFFSSGMKCAIKSVAPAFFIAALLTAVIHRPIYLAIIWILLYGVALLATQHFAPRSLVMLGLTFFLTGSVLVVSWRYLFMSGGHTEPSTLVVSGIMAGTFGAFHLTYAAIVWALGEERADAKVELTEGEHV